MALIAYIKIIPLSHRRWFGQGERRDHQRLGGRKLKTRSRRWRISIVVVVVVALKTLKRKRIEWNMWNDSSGVVQSWWWRSRWRWWGWKGVKNVCSIRSCCGWRELLKLLIQKVGLCFIYNSLKSVCFHFLLFVISLKIFLKNWPAEEEIFNFLILLFTASSLLAICWEIDEIGLSSWKSRFNCESSSDDQDARLLFFFPRCIFFF